MFFVFHSLHKTLLNNQIALFDFIVEEGNDFNTWLSQKQSEQQRRNDEQQQHAEIVPVAAPIHSRDGFAQGVDTVFERHKDCYDEEENLTESVFIA